MSKKTKTTEEPVFTESSGDVFADIGVEISGEDQLKFCIAREIARTIRKRDITQNEAAALLEVDQAKVSSILRGKLKDLSSARLIEYLLRMSRDIDMSFPGRIRSGKGRIRVSA